MYLLILVNHPFNFDDTLLIVDSSSLFLKMLPMREGSENLFCLK